MKVLVAPGPCLQGYGSWMQLGLWTHCHHPELRKGFLKQAYLPILSEGQSSGPDSALPKRVARVVPRVPIQLSKAVTLKSVSERKRHSPDVFLQ